MGHAGRTRARERQRRNSPGRARVRLRIGGVAMVVRDGSEVFEEHAIPRQTGYVGPIGATLLYLSLGVVFVWFGGMKFTDYEAHGIEPLLRNSPIWQWLFERLTLQQISALIGVAEILIGLLILCRPFNRALSALGGAGAIVCFLVTLSFLFTTPGVWATPDAPIPVLSAALGQFLLKDLVLLAASVSVLSESATRRRIVTTRI